jgi:hypothetical protein
LLAARPLIPILLLLVTASPFPALVVADEIRTPAQAETLCQTAPAELVAEGSGRPTDPVLQAHRYRDYSMTRYRRLTDVYAVLLDTNEFGFLPSEPGLLTVAVWSAFSLFDGLFELDLGNAPDFSFVVTDEQREAIEAGLASDQLRLRLYFHLISLDHPELAYCEVTDGGVTRILGRLLAADLIDRASEQPVAHAETERYQWSRVRFGIQTPESYQPPRPRVTITSTSFSTTDVAPSEDEVLRAQAEARLMPCYLRGLNLNGRLQGAIVVSLEVDAGGLVSRPTITIDALDQPLVTGCAVGALDSLPVPVQGSRSFRMRMTVIFRLE